MAIKVWEGLPGSGKTYAMVEDIAFESSRGRQCWVNFPLNTKMFPGRDNIHEWYDFRDFLRIKNGIIYCDEMHLWFDARSWGNMPPIMRYRFALHRHYALHIRGTTQSIARLDTVVRELMDARYICKPGFSMPDALGMKWSKATHLPFGWFTVNLTYDGEKRQRGNRNVIRRGVHWLTAETCELYNTFEASAWNRRIIEAQARASSGAQL